ncbi:MAG: hypothetical protein U1E49_03590 [Hyphomicrobiaceae bacterium]
MLLLLKLTLTPLVVTIATIVARRFGTRAGGMVTGLPLTAGPVSLFLALERGVPFAADAAMAMILSLISIAGFACGYRTAARWGWTAGVAAGFATHLTVTALLSQLPFTLPVAVLAAGAIVAVALTYVGGRRHQASKSQGSKFWELPLRMLVATTLVLVITTTAEAIGSRVAGLLTTLPIIASVIIVTAHRAGGPAEAVVAVRGHLLGSLSLGAFFAVLAAIIEPAGMLVAYAAAIVTAIAVNRIIMWLETPPALEAIAPAKGR